MKRKSVLKKLVAGVAVFSMAFTMLSPISVKAAGKIYYPKKQVVYQTSKTGGGYVNFSVDNIPKGQKVFKVTSNKTAVAKPYRIYHNNNEYTNTYLEKGMTQFSNTGGSRYANIELRALKKGTATISYKIGKSTKSCKTYKTILTVYAYENPIRSLTITGVNNGKNLASAFKTNNYAFETKPVAKNQSNARITVATNKNWKVTSISISKNYDNSYMYISYPQKSARTSLTLPVGTLKAKRGAYVYVNLYNTKTGGTQNCTYYIAGR